MNKFFTKMLIPVLFLVGYTTSFAQTIHYVDATATNGGNGMTWATAFNDLQAALSIAASGDQIWVAAGTYKPTTTADRNISFVMQPGVAMYGHLAGNEQPGFDMTSRDFSNLMNETILSGDIDGNGMLDDGNSYHVIFNDNNGLGADAILDGFTVSLGFADDVGVSGFGGGMLNSSSSPTLTNCSFVNNTADFGAGGMYNSNSSSPILTNCSFVDNTAGITGGGMHNINSSPTLTNCSFVNNTADFGGGMLNNNSSPTLTNCSFVNNTSNGDGGGMFNSNSSPTLTNCSFVNNSAAFGGGMYNINASPTLTNCSFVNNTADFGGGMLNNNSSPTLTNCSFVNNSAEAGIDGGMYNINASPTLTNCILWNNNPDEIINENNSNPTISHSLIKNSIDNDGNWNTNYGTDGGNNLDVDPLFAMGELTLQECSPAIDAGNDNANSEATDLNGNNRKFDAISSITANIDMGAFEYQDIVPMVTCYLDSDGDMFGDMNDPGAMYCATCPMGTVENNTDCNDGNAAINPAATEIPCNGIDENCDGTDGDMFPSTIVYVDGDASSGNNTGENWMNAFTDLQDALLAAGNCSNIDQIWVAAGTYKPTTTADRTISFVMQPGVAMYGHLAGNEPSTYDLTSRDFSDTANETILSGDIDGNGMLDDGNSYHVIFNDDNGLGADAILDGFTVSLGFADDNGVNGFGGGMHNNNASPTLTNCSFVNNSAGDEGAGGMFNLLSSPILTNCSFVNNSAAFGGGMYNINASPTLTNCSFVDNTAAGGGMYNDFSSPTLTNCSFVDNTAGSFGGGMVNSDSSPTLTNCSFVDNTAGSSGGGMLNGNSSPTLTNCSFVNNTADFGGGMVNSFASPTITNCSFVNNSAEAGIGGGMYNFSSSPIITNCILWDNNPAEIRNENNSNPTISYSLIKNSNGSGTNWNTNYGTDGGNNLDVDPLFAMGELTLQECSPAIDAGNDNANTETTDLNGNNRKFDAISSINANIDMGAFEYQDIVPMVTCYLDSDGDMFGDMNDPGQMYCNTCPMGTVENNTDCNDGNGAINPTATEIPCNGIDENCDVTDDGIFPSTIVYVDGDAVGGNNTGENWMNAFTDLQDALLAAGNCSNIDQIWVAAGTYKPTTTADRDISFVMQPGVAIYGHLAGNEPSTYDLTTRDFSDTANETILSGDIDGNGMLDDGNSYHVIFNDNNGLGADAILDGFTVSLGNANGGGNNRFGGGMVNFNSSPTITNCLFVDNTAGLDGGGMINVNSSPTITNCSFDNNTAGRSGGGMLNELFSSSILIINCSFLNNSADDDGGGMRNNGGSPTITNCSFVNNSAAAGGGMNNRFSSLTITNCILWNNTPDEIVNQTAVNPNISHSLIKNSLDNDGNWNTNYGTDNGNNLDADPLFEMGELTLQECSPAIDAGNDNANMQTTDLAGESRVFDAISGTMNNIDMGAFEYQDIVPMVTCYLDSDGDMFGDMNDPGAMYCAICPTGTVEDNTDCDDGNGAINPTATEIPCNGIDENCDVTDDGIFPSTIVYVDGDAVGGNNTGENWTNAFTDLQAALVAASNCSNIDQIWVAAGTYKPTTTADRSISFVMQPGVAMYGHLAGNEQPGFDMTSRDFSDTANETILSGDIDNDEVLDGDNSIHVIFNNNNILGADAILDGFTVSLGNANGFGNNDSDGGGMYNNNASPTITNCSFVNNTAELAGGMYNASSSSPTLTNCSFINNSADAGGGMFNINSSPTLTNCSFVNNSASNGGNGGGGMFNNKSSPTLTNCSFVDNTVSDFGGGMYNTVSSPTLTNCSFVNNSASNGGGMYNSRSSSTLTNCSFVNNSASNGGGMLNFIFSPTLTNCILWNNNPDEIRNTANSNPTISYSLIKNSGGSGTNWNTNYGTDGGNNLDVDPLFAMGELTLQECSPAIDAGNDNANTETTDLAGNDRKFDAASSKPATIDMGAYEFQGMQPQPTASCMPTITLQLNPANNNEVTIEAADLNSNSMGACGTLSFAINGMSQIQLGCADIGTESYTLRVTDDSGSFAECTTSLTIEDDAKPTIDCPTDQEVDANATCAANLLDYTDLATNVTDNCATNITVSQMPMAMTTITGMTNTITLTADDGNGNTENCIFNVAVVDNTNPTALCLNPTIQLDNTGNASITVADIDNNSNDACGIQSVSIPPTSFACTNVGTNTVVLTVIDNNNNSATCDATVTVEDNVMPTALCQNPTIQLDNTGNASITVAEIDNNSNDACGIQSVSIPPTSFACTNVGTNTVVLTVIDNNNNSATCDATVTVEDNVMPTALCLNPTIQLDNTGNASITVADIDNNSNDACGIQSVSIPPTSFACTNVGTNTVVLTVIDNNNNSATCDATVTVEDNIMPTALCQNPTIQLDNTGNASITVADIDNNSNDACGIQSVSIPPTSFACTNVGTNTVVLTVIDNNNNSATCDATVTVEDNVMPTALCQNPTIQLDNTGNASITVADIDNNSNDACGIQSTSISPTSFACTNVGTNTVVLTVIDNNNNSATCDATVTVEDNIMPTALCQNPTIQLDNTGNASITVADIDNNSNDACGIQSTSILPTSFDCINVGTNTVVLTVVDNNNNSATCDATVTVEDNIMPTALCQNPTIQLDNTGNASITVADIDNNSNDACGIQSTSILPTSFDCINVGTNTVVLTVVDNNNNSATCDATVTVEDNVMPTALCLNPTIQLNNTGNASITVAEIDNNSNDACGIQSTSISPTSFDCINVGTNTVVLTVIDNNNNSATCDATVTVEDNVMPTALCLNPTIQLDNTGNASITVADIDNNSNDACGIQSTSISPTSFACTNVGTNTVVLTVVDNNNNSATCDATVTVEDNVMPTALCLNPTIQLDNTGNASIAVTDIDNNSNDACGIQSTSISITSFACTNVGTNTVVLTVIDNNNNSATCDATVTVEDNIMPTALCQNPTIQLDNTGNASITVADIDNNSNDACGIQSTSISITSFACTNVGTNTVVLTVVDNNNNSATCDATVTVEDNIMPTALCQNPTIQLDNTGNASITVADIDNNSNDACGIQSVSIPPTSFACTNVGTNTVVLTVIDNNNNSATCDATVTVEDNITPTALCQNPTIQLDNTGNASITVADIDNNSNDACGIQSVSISPTSFACTNVGTNTVVLTVIDNNNNSATCDATVTVEDNVMPTALCLNPTIQLDNTGNASITVADIDNNSNDACGIQSTSISITSFACTNVGTNTVVLTVVDNNNNSATCDATVTVEDNIMPTALCQNPTIQLDNTGNASITVADIDNNSNDACGIQSTSILPTSFDCINVGTNTVVLTVVDNNNNSATCDATVTVEDNIMPTALCQNPTIQLDNTGNASITVADIDNNSNDACGIQSTSILPTSFDCINVGTNTVVLTVVDNNNNSATCDATVTVEDNVMPTALCLNPTIQLNNTGNASITVAEIDNNSNDACGIQSTSISPTSFDCINVGTNTVVLTVIDNNNNQATCNATVTVEDNVNPTALCQNVTIQLDASGSASTTAAAIDNGSNDNCGIASISLSQMDFTCANVGDNQVTLTITDVNSNVSTCGATVLVQDNILPTPLCQNVTIQLDASGSASTTAAAIDNGSNDNCGIASISLSQMDFTCANVGDNQVTLTITDVNSNVSTCGATVLVQDNILPIALCQNVTIQLDASGSASTTAAAIDNGSNDNCGIASISLSQMDFTCANVGDNQVTLTITDVNSNVSTCGATVLVQDNILPTALCQNVTIQLDANGSASTTAAAIDNGSNDNCGIASLMLSQMDFTCANVGDNQVTLTITDVNSNVSTCGATVLVQDNILPIALCQNVTIQLDASGSASTTAAAIDNGSNDNCGIASISLSQMDFTCANVGDNQVTLTITDVNSNVSTCGATVLVQDNILPTALCQNVTIQLDANGSASTTAAAIDNGSNDNCGIASLMLSQTDFDCSEVGVNNVTLTVTDMNMNVSTCPATVTVEDNILPTALCQNVAIQLDAAGNASTTAAAVDNGSNDNCGIATLMLSQTNFDCSEVGINNVILTVTDVNMNISTCGTTVLVQDNILPTALCQNVTIQLDAAGNASTTAAAVDNGSNDNCGIATLMLSQTNFDCSEVGINNVILTVTDVNMNISTCGTTVLVQDNILPTALCQNVTIQLDAAGNASTTAAAVDNGSNDNCGIATLMLSQTNFDCSEVGINNVILTVTDVNANVSTCGATVSVEDNIIPIALCQNPTLFLDANGNATLSVSDVDNGSNDACGLANLTLTNTAFNCTNVGDNPVTLTVVDNNGNTNACAATVTIVDDAPPVMICQDVNLFLDANGNAILTVAGVDNGSSDNCGIATLTLSQTAFDCSEVGTNTVTLTAIDVNGLNASCQATITVNDNILPTALCQNVTIQLDDTGNAVVDPAVIDNGSNDNCGIASLSLSNNSFDCTNIGGNLVNLTVTDVNGLSAACFAIITIEDNVDPVANCENVTVELDENGFTFTTPQAVGGNSSDACGIVNLILSEAVFDCSDIGNNLVVLTVIDVNGNSSNCTATVTVQDNQPAQILCRPSVNTVTDVDECTGSPILLPPLVLNDNCSLNSISFANNAPVGFPIGTTTVIWTLTDAGGNESTCSQNVTIVDSQIPTLICPVDLQVPAQTNCQVASSIIGNATVFDNCGAVTLSNDAPAFFNVGLSIVTYTASDSNGNTAVCEQYINVLDTTLENYDCPDNQEVISTDGEGVMVDFQLPAVNNGCGLAITNLSNEPGEVFAIGSTTVSFTVENGNGLSTNCEFDITVTPAVMLNCPEDFAISVGGDFDTNDEIIVPWNQPLATTICELPVLDNFENLRLLGQFNGHHYYLSINEDGVQEENWEDAKNLAAEMGGYLAIIDNVEENDFLTQLFPDNVTAAWIGLSDLSERDTFTWVDGSELDYTNWFNGMLPTDNDVFDGVVLQNDGLWKAEFSLSEQPFLLEIPDFKVTTNGDFTISHSDTFNLGTTTLAYTFVDSCGFSNTCEFDLIVQEEVAEYCQSEGQILRDDYWIQQVVINNTTFNAGENDGYEDFTSTTVEVDVADNLFFSFTPNITPDVPEARFWSAWIDWNNDGDFYDADELIFATRDIGAVGDLLPIPASSVETTVRMRVSMSLTGYPEPCGDLQAGEVEDYLLQIADNTVTTIDPTVSLLAYPNPTDGKVTLNWKGMDFTGDLVVITNSRGEEVSRQQIGINSPRKFNLSMQHLTDGVYWITVFGKGKPKTVRVILAKFSNQQIGWK